MSALPAIAPPRDSQPVPILESTIARLHLDLPNLDLLRSIAVLLVVFGHFSFFSGLLQIGPLNLTLMGFLGVQIFFVHTCLVLMFSLERLYQREHGLTFFVGFMIRRCFRIYPLSMLAVALVIIFHLPQATLDPGHFMGFIPDFGDMISSLFLVQSFTFRMPILGPIWSLSYELQMYLFLPLLFLVLRRGQPLLRVLGIFALVVSCNALFLGHMLRPNLATYVPCFLPGAIAYVLQRKSMPRLPALLWPATILVLVLTYLTFGENSHMSARTHWLERWAYCLALGLAIPLFSQLSARWLIHPAHLIAKYSYGIYLSHFFSIWFSFEHLSSWPLLAKIAVFASLMLGLPLVFFHLVEDPMIRLGKRLAEQFAANRTKSLPLSPPR